MKVPNDYPKALFLLQTTDTTMYIVTAVVIYYFGGKEVQSPALGSAGPLISKIAYGVAIPTVCTTMLLFWTILSYLFNKLIDCVDRLWWLEL